MSTVPTPAELDLRVRRLENETGSIYEILEQMQTTNEARFDGIDARFDGIDGRLDGIDARFDGIDGRLGAQGAQLSEILELLRRSGSQ